MPNLSKFCTFGSISLIVFENYSYLYAVKMKNMKIFLSYGHDSNAPLIEKIKEYLSKDAEGNFMYKV